MVFKNVVSALVNVVYKVHKGNCYVCHNDRSINIPT